MRWKADSRDGLGVAGTLYDRLAVDSRVRAVDMVLIVTAVLALYGFTLGYPFQFDDDHNIVKNPSIKSVSRIPSMFVHIKGALSNRPLTLATFAINYEMGALDPAGYRAVNIILHALCSCLLYLLVLATAMGVRGSRPAALIAGLLFAVHPVQTEAVTYIVSRSMLLAAACYLSGLILFARTVRSGGGMGSVNFALFTVVVFMGMASREDFATFPGMLLLYDWIYLSGRDARAMLKRARLYIPVAAGAAYLAFVVLSTDAYGESAGFDMQVLRPAEYFMTQFRVHMTYLRLLAFPVAQTLEYDFPIVRSLADAGPALAALAYFSLWALSVGLLLRRAWTPGFLVAWFMVTFTPSSGVVPLADVIFEHRLYLPSAGAFAGIGISLSYLAQKPQDRKPAFLAVVFSLVVALSTATAVRNYLWHSPVSLWENAVSKGPSKARAHYNLGIEYSSLSRYAEAVREYRAALSIEPDYASAHNALGAAYDRLGESRLAILEYQLAIDYDPKQFDAYGNLALVYAGMGRYGLAASILEGAAPRFPSEGTLFYILGLTYSSLGRLEEAVASFKRAVELSPADFKARAALEDVQREQRLGIGGSTGAAP